MGEIKLDFRVLCCSLCVFVLAVISVSSSDSSTSPNPNVEQASESQVSLVLERLDALEKRFTEEMSRQFKSSEKNWNEQFKSLKKELKEMRNENSLNEDVWLLTPPLRGRRGQKGEKGDSAGFRDSHSMSVRPATLMPVTNIGKTMNWEVNRTGENWIVAKGISRWEPNGRWGNPQLCPPGKFVTAHKFTYFSNSGLTKVELTCTNKYKTNERENGHLLRIKSADEPEINVIGEEWDIRNQGNRTNFAEGFSLNRRVMQSHGNFGEIRKMSKNYNMIYHGQIPEASALNSSGIVTKCPENHAICGLIPMMDDAELGILSAVGFKCCDICTPEQKWVTVHQFNNTKSSNETVQFNATVGLQQRSQIVNSTNLNLKNAVDFSGISLSDFFQEFSAHLPKSMGFNWTATGVSMGAEVANLTKTYTCKAQSSCVYRQLVGQCGNVRVPVDKFLQVSAPIGSSIPEHFTDMDTEVCGGAVSISEMTILRYSPQWNSTSSPCAWLVWSTTMTQIKTRLIGLEQGELTIYQSFDTSGSWTSSFKLTPGNLFQETSINSNIALLVFTPSSSSSSSSNSRSFEVVFTKGSAISGSRLVPTMSDKNPAVRKQLPSSSGYSDNERRFYIVYPPPGQKVKLTMESIDTEINLDTVSIFKFGSPSSPQNFQLVQTYSGTKTIGQSFEGGNSLPIILYLVTDHSLTKTGFRASIVTVRV